MNSRFPTICRLATCCLLLTFSGCRNPSTPIKKAPRPNLKNAPSIDHVVLISIDTLRADHLGCYGHPFVKSPNIDAFAEESLIFTQHISSAPTTLASHTALMTGTFPHTHGAPKNGFVLGDENEMLAETLAHAGFDTAGFIGALPLDARFNFDQGFAHFDADYSIAFKEGIVDQPQRLASQVTDAVIHWLDHREAAKEKDTKTDRMFMFVHYFDVHWPYEAPMKYRQMYGSLATRRQGSMENIEKARELLRAAETDKSKSDEAMALASALDNEYAAEITYCDEHVGRLFEALKKRGIYDKALIILTSDHGETMHEHDAYFSHGMTVYDTEVHTPLIVRFPGKSIAPNRIDSIVSNIDVAPTVLHLLSLPETKRMEGISFAGIVDGPLPTRTPIFAEATQPWWDPRFHDTNGWPNQGKYQCVRSEEFKYASRLPDQRSELYELGPDPSEQTNLLPSAKPAQRSIETKFKALLAQWRKQANPIPAFEDKSPQTKHGLDKLGYGAPSGEPVDATTN